MPPSLNGNDNSQTLESLTWFRERRDKWRRSPRTKLEVLSIRSPQTTATTKLENRALPVSNGQSRSRRGSSDANVMPPTPPQIGSGFVSPSVPTSASIVTPQKLFVPVPNQQALSTASASASTPGLRSTPFAQPIQTVGSSFGAVSTSPFGQPAISSGHKPASSASPFGQPSQSPDAKDYRQRLVDFYTKHNKSKLSSVDKVLSSWKGRETELFNQLKAKYEGYPRAEGKGPICFLDFDAGRVTIQLFADKVPKTAENFRALCTGERGTGRSGAPLCYRKSSIHRIVPNFCVQGGDITAGDGTGGESIYKPAIPNFTDLWGNFRDEKPFLQHGHAGLLSMANNGPDRNGSQFFFTLRTLPSLNGKHVVFGKVLTGMDVIESLGSLPTDGKQRPLTPVVILDSGEIRDDGTEIRASARDAGVQKLSTGMKSNGGSHPSSLGLTKNGQHGKNGGSDTHTSMTEANGHTLNGNTFQRSSLKSQKEPTPLPSIKPKEIPTVQEPLVCCQAGTVKDNLQQLVPRIDPSLQTNSMPISLQLEARVQAFEAGFGNKHCLSRDVAMISPSAVSITTIEGSIPSTGCSKSDVPKAISDQLPSFSRSVEAKKKYQSSATQLEANGCDASQSPSLAHTSDSDFSFKNTIDSDGYVFSSATCSPKQLKMTLEFDNMEEKKDASDELDMQEASATFGCTHGEDGSAVSPTRLVNRLVLGEDPSLATPMKKSNGAPPSPAATESISFIHSTPSDKENDACGRDIFSEAWASVHSPVIPTTKVKPTKSPSVDTIARESYTYSVSTTSSVFCSLSHPGTTKKVGKSELNLSETPNPKDARGMHDRSYTPGTADVSFLTTNESPGQWKSTPPFGIGTNKASPLSPSRIKRFDLSDFDGLQVGSLLEKFEDLCRRHAALQKLACCE